MRSVPPEAHRHVLEKAIIGKTLKADIGGARDEFVSEYSVPRIITQYQGLSLSTSKDFPDSFFSFRIGMVKPDRVWDHSGCFPTSF